MGKCYSHEHVVIKGPFIEQNFPEFILEDLDKICSELEELGSYGVGTMIDAMPIDAGRSASDLAVVSTLTGMNIVAPTGLHLRQYYPAGHWYDTIDEDELTQRFIDEIEVGISDDGVQTQIKAGVIKVAGSRGRLTDLERRNFRAAARAQQKTGCPILTHTEQGTAALEQIKILKDCGARLNHVVLSHLDRSADLEYQRVVLSTGVKLEYDSSFRWQGGTNQTLDLLRELAPQFPNSFVLGMDAANSSYWSSFNGAPGLNFLVTDFVPRLIKAGLSHQIVDNMFISTPAEAYSFE